MEDEAVIYFDSNAADSLDSYDTQKLSKNSAEVPEIFTQQEGNSLAINGLKNFVGNAEYSLGFKTGQSNTFSIQATEFLNFDSGVSIILKDKDLNTERDLTDGTAYTFESGVTNTTNRFSLIFRAPGVAICIVNSDSFNAQVFVNANNQITIVAPEKSKYAVYSAVGQLMENGILTNKLHTINNKLNTGVYVVKVGNQTNRVIIK